MKTFIKVLLKTFLVIFGGIFRQIMLSFSLSGLDKRDKYYLSHSLEIILENYQIMLRPLSAGLYFAIIF